MEDQTEIIEIKPKNMFVPICITQAVCVAVILIAVLIIKFFFESSYAKLQNWCSGNLLEETTISDVFDEEVTSEA
ncbi:MAG: hypothetical protein IJY79_02650 [Clostridia bacterium]|nr:hypothetical protein [Clostridia bacterium]